MRYKIIAYCTNDPYYLGLSKKFVESCNNFNLPYHLDIIESLGDWCLNTHWKAKFIYNCMNSIDSEYLLYVDVDAIFRKYPILLDSINCDIAYRTENFRWRSDEALSGTVFFKNNNNVKNLVSRWIELNESNPAERMKPETWEQKNMQRAQREMPEIDYFNLPPEYTYITDHTKTMYPGLFPVIEHFQASRETHRNTNQKSNLRIRR
jgi:hypothetical protein